MATLTVADETEDKATSDDRVYKATGLNSDAKYRVTLVDAKNVTVDKDGVVTFKKAASTPVVADRGDVQADITVVNGVPTRSNSSTAVPTVGGIVPNSGSIEFRVDGESYEQLVPVIYVDGGANTALELNDKGVPVEVYGLAGGINFLPEQADAGAIEADADIDAVDKSSKTIIAGDPALAYKYDNNDRFYVDKNTDDEANSNEQVTLAQFEAEVSKGDSLAAATVYQQNSEFASEWLLIDAAPGTPALAAEDGEGLIELAITPDEPGLEDLAETDSVKLYRATADLGDDEALGGADDDGDTIGSYSLVATVKPSDDDDTDTDDVLEYKDSVTAGTYVYKVKVSVSGEDSPESEVVDATSTADETAATIDSVTTADINNGVGQTSELIVKFNEPVSSVDTSKFIVSPSAQSGLEVKVTKSVQRNENGTLWTLTLAQPLEDAGVDIAYDVDVTAKAFKDKAGNESAAASGAPGVDDDDAPILGKQQFLY